MLPISNVETNESTVCHSNAANMQTRWLLKRVARELYKNTGEHEGVLLQALPEGRVIAFVILNRNNLRVDIPVEVWKGIEDSEFNVRRRRNGEWHSWKFRISLRFVVEDAGKVIRQALENLLRGNHEEFEKLICSEWLRDLNIVWPSDADTTVAVQRTLLDRLLAIINEAADDSLVYIAKDEALQFIGAPVSQNGRVGRRSLDSDRFWFEVLGLLIKEKPRLSREQITNSVCAKLAQYKDANEQRSSTWVKSKLKAAYEYLGWLC
jgi:hypothetical protein